MMYRRGKSDSVVANVIPPQKAGRIAERAGVADQTGWCAIDPVTFESRLQPNIHVIGDAAIAVACRNLLSPQMRRQRFCAAAVVKLLRGETPVSPKLINTCYSLRGKSCRRAGRSGRQAPPSPYDRAFSEGS